MRKSAWALLALAAMIVGTTGIVIMACGVTDPAQAPAGARVRIIGATSETWEIGCNEETGLSDVCMPYFRREMIAYCEQYCAETECPYDGDCELYWTLIIPDADYSGYATAAVSKLSNPGECGYNTSIVTAFVEKFTYGAATDTESAEAENLTGGTIGGEPMNDIEIRFIAYDGEMYKLSDNESLLPPLKPPYVTRTDDRGKAEIKYRVPRPTTCEFVYTYRLEADIGVSKASFTVDFNVEEAGDQGTTTDDDDDTGT